MDERACSAGFRVLRVAWIVEWVYDHGTAEGKVK